MIPIGFIIYLVAIFTWLFYEADWMHVRLPVGACAPCSGCGTNHHTKLYTWTQYHDMYRVCLPCLDMLSKGNRDINMPARVVHYQCYDGKDFIQHSHVICGTKWLDAHKGQHADFIPELTINYGKYSRTFSGRVKVGQIKNAMRALQGKSSGHKRAHLQDKRATHGAEFPLVTLG